jgi:hypothetical protein
MKKDIHTADNKAEQKFHQTWADGLVSIIFNIIFCECWLLWFVLYHDSLQLPSWNNGTRETSISGDVSVKYRPMPQQGKEVFADE